MGIVIAQEIEQTVGLTAARTEVNVGDEECPEPYRAVLEFHESRLFVVRSLGNGVPLQHNDTIG
jgi:hypothetical protein